MQHPEKRNPALGGASWKSAGERRFHVDHATAEPLLQRLEGVQQYGKGWRARCPACGGKSRKLAVTQADDKVLVHCFGGCKGDDVIGAVGLRWADLFPPRYWPQSPQERKDALRRMREAGWAAALQVLPLEVAIVQLACAKAMRDEPLDWNDYCRLVKAEDVIANAAAALVEVRHG